MLVHLLGDAFVVERPHRGVVVQWIAQFDRGHCRRQLCQECVLNPALNEDALPRCTTLPGAKEAAGNRSFRGAAQVRILEDHDRAVAAQLQHHVLAGGPPGDRSAGFGRADEADAGHQRMACDLIADHRAGAGHQVHGACREVGLGQALHQLHTDRRRRTGRRPDDGIAPGERRGDELGRHRQRPVPRGDHAVDAPGNPQGKDQLILGHRRDDIGLQAFDVFGGDSEILDGFADFAERFRLVRLPLVEAEPSGQLLAPLLHDVGHPVQQGRPLEGAEPGHRRPCPVRRLDGARGISPGAFRQGGDHLAGRRAYRLEGGFAFRVDPPAAHEHLERRGFFDDLHRAPPDPASTGSSLSLVICGSYNGSPTTPAG